MEWVANPFSRGSSQPRNSVKGSCITGGFFTMSYQGSSAGDLGSIPGLGRPPGEGNGNPLQRSCLGNPMNRGAWWATFRGVARVGHDLATLPPPNSAKKQNLQVGFWNWFIHSPSGSENPILAKQSPYGSWNAVEMHLLKHWVQFSSVQSHSHVQLFATPWTAARQASLPITNSWSLFKLMSIESVIPSNHLSLLSSPSPLPSVFPSIKVFSNESALHIRWPKYRSFSFSISPSNEYSGLISFRIDWFDLLRVQGTLKKLVWCTDESRCTKLILCIWHLKGTRERITLGLWSGFLLLNSVYMLKSS